MTQKTTSWRTVLRLLALACCVLLQGHPAAAAATGSQGPRDMVWSASDGHNQRIYFSTFANGSWSAPVRVTGDNGDHYLPCIDRAADGTRHLVWATYDEYGQTIQHATLAKGKWSAAERLPALPATSGAPFVTVDDRGRVFVVFIGNDGEDDDIYWSRLENGTWSESRRVHADNDTPDLHPYVEITDTNTVVVTWQGYRGESYVTLQSVWSGDGWQPETVVDEADGQAEEESEATAETPAEPLPDFVTDKRQVFTRIHGQ